MLDSKFKSKQYSVFHVHTASDIYIIPQILKMSRGNYKKMYFYLYNAQIFVEKSRKQRGKGLSQ